MNNDELIFSFFIVFYLVVILSFVYSSFIKQKREREELFNYLDRREEFMIAELDRGTERLKKQIEKTKEAIKDHEGNI